MLPRSMFRRPEVHFVGTCEALDDRPSGRVYVDTMIYGFHSVDGRAEIEQCPALQVGKTPAEEVRSTKLSIRSVSCINIHRSLPSDQDAPPFA